MVVAVHVEAAEQPVLAAEDLVEPRNVLVEILLQWRARRDKPAGLAGQRASAWS